MIDQTAALTLDAQQVKDIRRALLIGLTCFGQVEEVSNFWDVRAICGETAPEGAVPLHPTGSPDVPSIFADALMNLD